ncbi:hypothetical protein LTR36_001069 [Oleoguttula mirabilis]|uniref:N-acetyltransferase domain-containing protein n=1 Tax=Oleoguttula mirabilis TaxID=1507867 RepID=A0AAV9JPW0_9PEZI|nr:hypothetical protein LTR36_001069 [Oleoguttula mirabilis]
MADYGLAQAMFAADVSGKTRQQSVVDWARERWDNANNLTWVKVTDTDSGNEMIAAALWRFESGGEPSVPEEVKEEQRDAGPPSVFDAMGRLGKEFIQEFIGTKPHHWLSILVTRPDHQRRGAGSMLVKWGCDKADEQNVMCALTASVAGLATYTKQGFVVVKEADLDLRPYGVDETEIRRSMIRPAKAQAI